jgi:hypothetical protein
MYVRWKVRKLSRRGKLGPARRAFYAVLVECRRVDGQPRQKVVKYLAHINEQDLGISDARRLFWEQANDGLGTIEIGTDERARIEEKLEEVVPRPPAVTVGLRRKGGTKALAGVSAPTASVSTSPSRRRPV